jgi:hypothetical protein
MPIERGGPQNHDKPRESKGKFEMDRSALKNYKVANTARKTTNKFEFFYLSNMSRLSQKVELEERGTFRLGHCDSEGETTKRIRNVPNQVDQSRKQRERLVQCWPLPTLVSEMAVTAS